MIGGRQSRVSKLFMKYTSWLTFVITPSPTHIIHTIFQDHRTENTHINIFLTCAIYLYFALKWMEFVIFFVSNLERNVTQ